MHMPGDNELKWPPAIHLVDPKIIKALIILNDTKEMTHISHLYLYHTA